MRDSSLSSSRAHVRQVPDSTLSRKSVMCSGIRIGSIEVIEALSPAVGESLRFGVGEHANAALARGDASAHAELVVAAERGVMGNVGREVAGLVGDSRKSARDLEVKQAPSRLRRLEVRGLANEIVREVVRRGSVGRTGAAQDATPFELLDASQELGGREGDHLPDQIGAKASTERRCPAEQRRRSAPRVDRSDRR